MEEVEYSGLRNGNEGCGVLQDCLEEAGITWVIHGRGSVEELVSSLDQFAWFRRLLPLQWGIAFVPSGDDQVVMGMVSTPSGVAAIFPVFNNLSAQRFMDDFVGDVMSLQPRWTAGFSTLGATMSSALASFLSEPRLVDLGAHLELSPPQELPDTTVQQMVRDGWEPLESRLLNGVLSTSSDRTQVVFGQNGPVEVLALSPVGEFFEEMPEWTTNQDWGTRGRQLMEGSLFMTQCLDIGPSCTIEYARTVLGDLAAHADNVESQLSPEDRL